MRGRDNEAGPWVYNLGDWVTGVKNETAQEFKTLSLEPHDLSSNLSFATANCVALRR